MANEKRLIDVERHERILERFEEHMVEFGNVEAAKATRAIINGLKIEPIVDAVEVVHGRWNKRDWGGVSVKGFMACSACNVMIPTADDNRYCLHKLNYCPNCGAKMDGDGNV